MQFMAAGEALGHGHHHVGLLQDLRGHQVVLRAQGDFALNPHLAQSQVHMPQTAAATGNMDVGLRQVIVEAEFFFGRQRVALAHGADVFVFHHLHVAHLRVGVERGIDSKIQTTGGQFLGGLAALGQEAFDDYGRCHPSQTLEQRWQDHRLGEVGHADAVSLARLQRVEDPALLHRHPQQRQRITHRTDDVLGHGRGHHALRGAHEQRVVEGLAQAGQSVGNSGLGDADNLSGASQVGFGVDGIKDNKEVEVDLAQIHSIALSCCFYWVVA